MRGVPLRECEKGRNVMKSIKRRLLSLFMAMVMVCSLAPSALATEGGSGTENPPVDNPDIPIVSHEHNYVETSRTEATCTTEGSVTKTCNVAGCPEPTITETIPAKGHTWTSVKVNATCTTAGSETKTCSVCNSVETEPIPALGHDFSGTATVIIPATCGTAGKQSVKCTRCDATEEKEIPATGKHTKPISTTDYKEVDDKQHSYICSVCGKTVLENHTFVSLDNGSSYCRLCGYTRAPEQKLTMSLNYPSHTFSAIGGTLQLKATLRQGTTVVENADIRWKSSNPSAVSVDEFSGYTTARGTGNATITAYLASDETVKATCVMTVASGLDIDMTPSSGKLTQYGATATLTLYFNGVRLTSDQMRYMNWDYDERYVSVSNNSNGTATVTALRSTGSSSIRITGAYTDTDGKIHQDYVTVSVSASASNVATVTVYNSTDRYNLNDRDDAGDSSIIDQLEDYFSRTSSWYYGLESVSFGSTVTNTYGNLSATANRTYYVNGTSSQLDLADVYFVPSTRTGTATFNITANVYTSSSSRVVTGVACTISFKVEEGTSSGGDVIYTASVGDNVYFNVSDFEDFWDDNFSRGTLESVSFKVSGGTLRDSDGKTVGTKDCYVSPRSSQVDLDGVYFEPNSTTARRSGTVKFTFTATGYSRNSSRATTKSGTVSIIYLNNSPKDITYSVASGSTVNLRASDFTAAYKEATGSNAPSGMTIVFQNVPRNGTLTYTDSSKRNASAVTLTSSNIKSRNFTTRTSGTNQIEDVSYRGTSATDTIDYIAYSGSTPQFTGKVVFNGAAAAPTDISVTFTSTSGTAAAFSSAAFTTANASVLAKTTRIRFTTPSNGSLLLNGATNAVGIDIYPSNLGSVSYKPKAGFNGTDKCMFMAYDSTNTLVGSGTVNFVVAGNPSTTTPTTPTTPGASSISQFKDVSATAWYRTELADLVSKGIIKGKSTTSFAPRDTVTYGEALKMVLRAAGYTAEEPAGSNWAINYKTLAVSKGWISNDIGLNNPIPRSAMADLVAKVLGIASSSAASPFADTANGYAVALYNAGIFKGETGADGKPYFNGSNSLLREQICAVIYRVNQYYTNTNSNQMPDGI